MKDQNPPASDHSAKVNQKKEQSDRDATHEKHTDAAGDTDDDTGEDNQQKK